MEFAQGSIWVLVLFFVAAAAHGGEDVLQSQRSLGKRAIDADGNYNISFYHINDVHAHLDQFRASGMDCPDKTMECYGGYARVKTVIKESRPDHEDSLFLNVGDEFQVPGPGTTFSDPVVAVQNTIDFIKRTTNIKRIAAITHIGYQEDQHLAASTTGLQLIMGGHSHTPLGDMEGAAGPYPTITLNKDGEEVFIVTA
ncbi:Metallo-dependent phosphatase [Diplocarpon rosae]|nr:Metallo-dependent phosphatase [Diplocarpon rosae]